MKTRKGGWKCGNLQNREIPTFPPPRLLRLPITGTQTFNCGCKSVNYVPGLKCQLCPRLHNLSPSAIYFGRFMHAEEAVLQNRLAGLSIFLQNFIESTGQLARALAVLARQQIVFLLEDVVFVGDVERGKNG